MEIYKKEKLIKKAYVNQQLSNYKIKSYLKEKRKIQELF